MPRSFHETLSVSCLVTDSEDTPLCLWRSEYGTFDSTGHDCESHGGHRLNVDSVQGSEFVGELQLKTLYI